MMKTQQKGIKTINLNSDLFTQQSPKKCTIPVNLLRSFVERKRNAKSTKNKVQRYLNLNSKTNPLIHDEDENSHLAHLDLPTPSHLKNPGRNTIYHLKTHSKAPAEIYTRKRHNSIDHKEERSSAKDFFQHKAEQPEQQVPQKQFQDGKIAKTRYDYHTAAIEKIAKHFQKDDYNRVNPYTQQEYTYIKHKENDHLAAIKKTTRFRRISSIMQSYKIQTIELTPQIHKRRPSLQPTANMKSLQKPSKNHTIEQKKTAQTPVFKRTKDLEMISPSPWDWGYQADFSKDFIY